MRKPRVKCRIQWIDCNGKPTPDKNDAVGDAIAIIAGEESRIPICAAHLVTLGNGCAHHDATCAHVTDTATNRWTYEPYKRSK